MQHWRFVNDGRAWRWQRSNGENAVSSHRHKSFGAALNDALDHGFRPRADTWIVEDERTLATFQPGRLPKIASK